MPFYEVLESVYSFQLSVTSYPGLRIHRTLAVFMVQYLLIAVPVVVGVPLCIVSLLLIIC